MARKGCQNKSWPELVVGLCVGGLENLLDALFEVFACEIAFGEVVLGTLLQGFLADFLVVVSRQKEDGGAVLVSDAFEDFKTCCRTEHVIEQNAVDGLF